jgi:hypothetical protein
MNYTCLVYFYPFQTINSNRDWKQPRTVKLEAMQLLSYHRSDLHSNEVNNVKEPKQRKLQSPFQHSPCIQHEIHTQQVLYNILKLNQLSQTLEFDESIFP